MNTDWKNIYWVSHTSNKRVFEEEDVEHAAVEMTLARHCRQWGLGFHKVDSMAAVERAPENLVFGLRGRFDVRPPCPAFKMGAEYWRHPDVTKHLGRSHVVTDTVGAEAELARLRGLGHTRAFIKQTKEKAGVYIADLGSKDALLDTMGYDICQIEGLPETLMVQEYVKFKYEFRLLATVEGDTFFSRVKPELSPISRARMDEWEWAAPAAWTVSEARRFAESIAAALPRPICVDVGFAEGHREPILVELNPFWLGSIGLYNLDVEALVAAVLAYPPDCHRADLLPRPLMIDA